MKEILIVAILGGILGNCVGKHRIQKLMGSELEGQKILADKHLDLFLLMNQWVKNHIQGKMISSFFKRMAIAK